MAELSVVATQLNNQVASVLSQKQIIGFEKSYLYAEAIQNIKSLLTPEYMKPIMALQGSKLGFRTDKDRNKDGTKGVGYPEDVVKDCLIEAVLTGLQPYGNQFNIIAGNMYPTKEGFGYLLKNYEGLSYELIPALPRINAEKTGAAVVMGIKYQLNSGEVISKEIDFPVSMNAYMGTDAVLGKATRKARAWLYNTLTGSEIPDGDAGEQDGIKTIPIKATTSTTASTSINHTNDDKEKNRIALHIQNAKDVDELNLVIDHIEFHNLQTEFAQKMQQLNG